MLFLLVTLHLLHKFINVISISGGTTIGARVLSTTSVPACICNDYRSIWDIIWSCLATLFACSWVSIHPNIPGPSDPSWKIALRRLELMCWTLIAPELIILWAMRQWYGARQLARQYHAFGWSKTHAHFLQMGGFMLYKGNEPQERLLPEKFKQLLELGKIDFPSISEKQIKDKSKGDGLSKALVVTQTSWFIAQCIARLVQKVDLTQLELATAAFAILNGFIYFLWWHKPLDVRCPEPLHLLELPRSPIKLQVISTITTDEEVKPFFRRIPSSILGACAVLPLSCYSALLWTWDLIQKRGILWVLFAPPFFFVRFLYRRLGEMLDSTQQNTVDPLQMAPFYSVDVSSPSTDLRTSCMVSACLAVVFGGIHCAGWISTFPTPKEELYWRVASVIITCLPLAVVFASLAGFLSNPESSNFREQLLGMIAVFLFLILLAGFLVYIASRFFLLVEAVASLRSLPPAAYAVVQWTSFIPHI